MAQPQLRGTNEGLFGLATPAGVRAWSAHRRLRMMNPAGSGSSACESTVPDPELRDQVAEMLAAIGWQGSFMVEPCATYAARQTWLSSPTDAPGEAWSCLWLVASSTRRGRRAGRARRRPWRAADVAAGGWAGVCAASVAWGAMRLIVMRGPCSVAVLARPRERGMSRDVFSFPDACQLPPQLGQRLAGPTCLVLFDDTVAMLDKRSPRGAGRLFCAAGARRHRLPLRLQSGGSRRWSLS